MQAKTLSLGQVRDEAAISESFWVAYLLNCLFIVSYEHSIKISS